MASQFTLTPPQNFALQQIRMRIQNADRDFYSSNQSVIMAIVNPSVMVDKKRLLNALAAVSGLLSESDASEEEMAPRVEALSRNGDREVSKSIAKLERQVTVFRAVRLGSSVTEPRESTPSSATQAAAASAASAQTQGFPLVGSPTQDTLPESEGTREAGERAERDVTEFSSRLSRLRIGTGGELLSHRDRDKEEPTTGCGSLFGCIGRK